MTILVSVITPTLNSEDFILECLKSVQLQNTSDIKVEHILVDGGSSDSTYQIFQNFHSNSNKRFVAANGTSQSEALNIGLANINPLTKWVGWLNSDERYEPNAFKNLLEHDSSEVHSCVLYGDFYRIDVSGRILKLNRQWKYDLPIGALLTPTIQNCAALFNRDCIPDPFIDESYDFIMDWDFYVRVMSQKHANATYVSEVIGNYMMQPQSKTAQNQEMFNQEISIFNRNNFPNRNVFSLKIYRKFLVMKFFIILLKDGKFFDKLYFKLFKQRKYGNLFGK